jgi:hypothetical protein
MDATTVVLSAGGLRKEKTFFLKGELRKARKEGKQAQFVGERKASEFLRMKFWCITLGSGYLATPVFTIAVPGLIKMVRMKV